MKRIASITILGALAGGCLGVPPDESTGELGSAITGNYTRGFEHPYVGLVVFYNQAGAFRRRCSGRRRAPTVVLTAGHCVTGVASARVYFQQDAGAGYSSTLGYDPTTGYPVTCLSQPCAASHSLHSYGYPGDGM